MRTVNMYEIGEEVLIKAVVTDVIVDKGKLKYKLKTEHSNNDIDHTFTDAQIIYPNSDIKKIVEAVKSEEDDLEKSTEPIIEE